MNFLHRINGGGDYGDLTIAGKDERSRNNDTGVVIFVPEGEIARFGDIRIKNTYNPLINLGKGLFTCHSIDIEDSGGDLIQIRGKSFHSKYNRFRGDTPTRPYTVCIRDGNESIEECLDRHHETVWDPSILEFERHPDYPFSQVIMSGHLDVCQLHAAGDKGYPREMGGVLSDIKMPNIIARLDDQKSQMFMGSEETTDYDGLELGTESLDVDIKYPFAFVFGTLKNSKLGCEGAKLNGAGVRIKEVKSRPLEISTDAVRTENNLLLGFESDCIIEECLVHGSKVCRIKENDHTTDTLDEQEFNKMAMEAMEAEIVSNELEPPMSHTKLLLITALGMSARDAEKWADSLDKASVEFGIDTDKRFAGWLAQMAHESMNFYYTEEIWGNTRAQRRYDTRTDLGNTPERDGDGKANKGVGPLQITGNYNLTQCAKALGIPRNKISELLTTDSLTGARGAGWWWKVNKANVWADKCDITAMSGLVNCGNPRAKTRYINHLPERKEKYTAIIRFMGIHEKSAIQSGGGIKEKVAQAAGSRGVQGTAIATVGTGATVTIASSILDRVVNEAVSDPVGSAKQLTDKAGEVTESFGMLATMIGVNQDNYVEYLKYGLMVSVGLIVIGICYFGYSRLDDMRTGRNP